MKMIFFDLETNGNQGASVLSISALKYEYDFIGNFFSKIDEYNRYYFRIKKEELNHKAIKINGLKDNVIAKYRENVDYPMHFINDIEGFKIFCSDTKHYIAHNIDFDSSFIPILLTFKFCTMKSNKNIIKLNKDSEKKTYKWPKLIETARFYKIEIDENKLHTSLYDTYLVFLIFKEMINKKESKNIIYRFLKNI